MFWKSKLITFVVPCFNSAKYMERCINTLLKGKEDVEIIIVNDGSTDDTLKIANGYKKRFPKIIKVIDKENGGHGSGVNVGIKKATGKYFKVVDSDDWLDEESLSKLIFRLKVLEDKKKDIDLVVCNYIYDHLYDGYKKTMRFHNIFIEGKVINWEHTASFKNSQYLIMHSLIYKTDILKKSKMILPEHTYYDDNIFCFVPLQYVNKICYFDLDLYHFFIGRDDQTINENVAIKKIDEQIKVTKILLDEFDYNMIQKKSIKLRKYLLNYLSMMVSICDVYLLKIGDEEALKKKADLWEFAREKDYRIYNYLKTNPVSRLTNLHGKLGNKISLFGYKIAKKIFKFN